MVVLCLAAAVRCRAQDPSSPPDAAPNKRAFGVLPNNRTVEGSAPFVPITAKQKLVIACKDSFDWPVLITSGVFASLYQLENQSPSFGQGMKGYARRYAASYGDQLTGNMMAEGFIPALTHEDPRYFRVGEGTKKRRAGHALASILVTRTDSNHRTFNIAEVGGNAIAVAVSNAYYPDTRTAGDNGQKLAMQLATDALSNLLKEFWPDVRRRLQRKKK